jgi:beta-fructofuranosidase
MVLALRDKWIWDSWYAHDGEKWHAYFLQADKAIGEPELRHWNVSQGHAVSKDLVSWRHLGTCFAPAAGPAWDDYTSWTGSVVRDDRGLWHLFYTGSCHAEDGLIQRIGHATSSDMHNWERFGDGLCLDLAGPVAEFYEADHAVGVWHDRAMRDPWVMRDPEGDGWLMFFTARVPDVAEPNDGGAIGLATSPDLRSWTLQAPVHTGGYGQLEVPQVFQVSGTWYCLFCTSADHFSKKQAEAIPGGPVTGTHYLMAARPRGPWRLAPGPFLDGARPCRRYAGRILRMGKTMVIMGFADRPTGGSFVGEIMDPEPVSVKDDGLLQVATEFQPAL